MTNRDIYIAHLRHRGSRYDTAMSLAAEIRHVVNRRRLTGLIGQLKFVYVPPTSHPPYATLPLTRRNEHANAVELLNGLLFKGQPTMWRLGNNTPRRDVDVPQGAQFVLDRHRPRPREPVQPRPFIMRRPGVIERLPTPPASPPPRYEPVDDPERPESPPPGQPDPAPAPAVPSEVFEELEDLHRRVAELELDHAISARALEFGNRHVHFRAYLDGQLRATQAEKLLRAELLHRDHDFYG